MPAEMKVSKVLRKLAQMDSGVRLQCHDLHRVLVPLLQHRHLLATLPALETDPSQCLCTSKVIFNSLDDPILQNQTAVRNNNIFLYD